MMVIRKVDVSEVPYVTRFMKRFEKATEFVKVDVEYSIGTYVDLISNDHGVMIVAEAEGEMVGGIGGIKAPDLHNGDMIAVETFWFVDPEYSGPGLQLWKAFEEWAKEEGCVKVAMIHLEDSCPATLETLYRRRGYKPIERHYVKEIAK